MELINKIIKSRSNTPEIVALQIKNKSCQYNSDQLHDVNFGNKTIRSKYIYDSLEIFLLAVVTFLAASDIQHNA